jgi:hypothetical protein
VRRARAAIVVKRPAIPQLYAAFSPTASLTEYSWLLAYAVIASCYVVFASHYVFFASRKVICASHYLLFTGFYDINDTNNTTSIDINNSTDNNTNVTTIKVIIIATRRGRLLAEISSLVELLQNDTHVTIPLLPSMPS